MPRPLGYWVHGPKSYERFVWLQKVESEPNTEVYDAAKASDSEFGTFTIKAMLTMMHDESRPEGARVFIVADKPMAEVLSPQECRSFQGLFVDFEYRVR